MGDLTNVRGKKLTKKELKIREWEQIKEAIRKVIAKYEDPRHCIEGGHGVSCYVWANDSLVGGCNSLRLDNGVENAIRAIPGVWEVHINID